MSRTSSDVVVVGGGIIGAAIAHQIVVRSALRVMVVDKGAGPGEGSTGASSSIVRVRYSHADVIRLAVDALHVWNDWSGYTGIREPRAAFQRTGGLWIDDRTPDSIAAEVDRMRACGAVVETVSDLSGFETEISPCVESLDVDADVDHACRPGDAFLYEGGAGYVDPMAALEDLLEAATTGGADIRFRSAVSAISTSGGRVDGVELRDGTRVDAEVVVNAAGPWCGGIDALAGLDHGWPLSATRIQTVYVGLSGPTLIPIIFDGPTGIYMRPNGRTLLMGGIRESDESEHIDDPDDFRRTPDTAFRDRMISSLSHRCPALTAGAASGIAGLYTINHRDVHPLVGSSELDGYWLAAGFSGHGFKLAPMIGSMVARAITGQSSEVDPTAPPDLFGLDRVPFAPQAKSVLA